MYTSFCEKSFVPLVGNVDTNNICLNELGKDVMNVQENVWSISQKVHKMGQTVSSFEKSLDSINNKELIQLKRDFISLKSRVLDFIDLCQQVGCFESLGCQTADEIQVGMSGHSYDNIVSKIDRLEKSLCNLEAHMDRIEIQCRQFAPQTGKMDDDVCCNACTRVADSLTMNTKNINGLYTALVSEGLLTEKMGENLITNGWQVVGPDTYGFLLVWFVGCTGCTLQTFYAWLVRGLYVCVVGILIYRILHLSLRCDSWCTTML